MENQVNRSKALERADRQMMKDGYPLFRRFWDPNEEPICICGSTIHCRKLLFLVRIKESADEDVEATKENYRTGLNQSNIRITLSETLKRSFPQMLLSYYEKNVVFVKSAKDEEKTAEEAAMTNLLKVCVGQHIQMDAGPVYREMMKDLPKQLAEMEVKSNEAKVDDDDGEEDPPPVMKKAKTAHEPLLNEKTKEELLQMHNASTRIGGPEDKEEEQKNSEGKGELDQYGLPYDYGETDYSDYCSSGSDD